MPEIRKRMTEQVETFYAETEQQMQVKAQALADCELMGSSLLHREQDPHFTSSAIVCNETLTKILLVHHNLYQTYTWPGGHVDGSAEFLQEAIREVKEETGLETVLPISGEMLALDLLPVPEQQKNGRKIPPHDHYSVGYGCVASENEVLKSKPDENSHVCWVDADKLEQYSNEPHMLRIYHQIFERMQNLRRKKESLFAKLPDRLIPWYRANARALPWRKDQEPYHVWISEIMLQQTRVEAVKGYYTRFLETFPTIEALANGEEAVLLKCWEGLGYYNRARNLQKAAQTILQQFGGIFPSAYEQILSLSGIGEYTAGAIASICYEQQTPAVDGNVLRVITRLTEDFRPVDSAVLKKEITKQLAEKAYPQGNCGDLTQSLMELGATVCVPNGQPKCACCPLQELCMAKKNQTQLLLPVKKKKAPRKRVRKTVFVLQHGSEIAVERREEKGVLHGLWQLPNVEGYCTEQEAAEVLAEWGIGSFLPDRVTERKHIFTHIEWEMRCYYLRCSEKSDRFLWVSPQKLEAEITLPTAFKMFTDEL